MNSGSNNKMDPSSPNKSEMKNSKDDKMETNFDFRSRLNLNYVDFDAQKGSLSPRFLFRKRKNEQLETNKNQSQTTENPIQKKANKLKESFDTLMDFVHDTYFTENSSETSSNDRMSIENANHVFSQTNFKFTSLDLLINPLRQKFTWETWSPYEIALFHCCICKFGPKFDFFNKIIKTKEKEEIIDFYCYWKCSKYYKIWKNNKHKKIKKMN